MKTWTIFLALTSIPVFGQNPSEPAQPAPPDVDAALRARVEKFYQAHEAGKFLDALELVAPDFRDQFIAADKSKYTSCEISKIVYADGFTTATVVEGCKTDWRWHGRTWPATVPLTTHWKVVDGQWCWYAVKETVYQTPWGPSKIEDPPDGESRAALPKDPDALAKTILQEGVKLDKMKVRLDPTKVNEDHVELTNGMPGHISIAVGNLNQPGLIVKADKTELGPGEKSRVMIRYDPNDASVQCGDCATHLTGKATVLIQVRPLNRFMKVAVLFERPPASAK